MRDYYPNISKSSGIYMWYNTVNGKKYVGSAKNLFQRCGTHIRQMRLGKSTWGHLQSAYNKYGESKLLFVVLLECPSQLLIEMEQYFMDKLNPEYNIRLIASSNTGLRWAKPKEKKETKPRVYTEECNTKIGKAHKGLVMYCKTLKGKLISPTGEVFENITNLAEFGRLHGLDRRRMSDFLTGRRTYYRGWRVI